MRLIFIILFSILGVFNSFSQCGGAPPTTFQTYAYAWDETCTDITIKSDRNDWFNQGSPPPTQLPSGAYEMDVPAYSTGWGGWNSCIGAAGVPAPSGVISTLTIQAVTFSWPAANECCEDYLEGIFANQVDHSNPGGGYGSVEADVANGICNGAGQDYNYNPQAGAGTAGTWDSGIPHTVTTGGCTGEQSYSETMGLDIIVSFLTDDALLAGCTDCENSLQNGWISIEFDLMVEFVICDKNFSAPYSAGSPCTSPPGTCGIVLALESFDFNAYPQSDKMLLTRVTQDEVETEKFEIYRSTNNKDFDLIKTINPSKSESSTKNYATHDGDVKKGVKYFYKIVVFEESGKTEESYVVDAIIKTDFSSITFAPNPAINKINFSIALKDDEFEPFNVKIIDITGKEIKAMNVNSNMQEVSFDLKELESSVYFVVLTKGLNQEVRKLVVRK